MNPKPEDAGRRRIDPLTVMNIVFSGSFGLVGLGGLIAGVMGAGLVAWIIGASFLLTAILSGWLMLVVSRFQRRAFAEFGSALRSSLPTAGDESLRETGDAGVAVVVGLADTGTTINDGPVVRFTLRVRPADGSPEFTAELTQLVSRIAVPRAGDHCPVYYDPADRSRLLATGPFVNGPVPDGAPVWGSPSS